MKINGMASAKLMRMTKRFAKADRSDATDGHPTIRKSNQRGRRG